MLSKTGLKRAFVGIDRPLPAINRTSNHRPVIIHRVRTRWFSMGVRYHLRSSSHGRSNGRIHYALLSRILPFSPSPSSSLSLHPLFLIHPSCRIHHILRRGFSPIDYRANDSIGDTTCAHSIRINSTMRIYRVRRSPDNRSADLDFISDSNEDRTHRKTIDLS